MKALFVLLAGACASAGAFATDFLIDDFATGLYASPQLKSGTFTNVQTGSMRGGSRSILMTLCGSNCRAGNRFADTASFKVVTSRDNANPVSAMVQNAGFNVYPRIDMVYGEPPGNLDIDLSAFDRLRFDFLGATETLNFNVQLFDDTGLYIQGGCNYGGYNSAFTLELPLNAFAMPGGPIDLRHVTHIDVIFQASSFIGASEFAVSNFSASNVTQAGAVTCAYQH